MKKNLLILFLLGLFANTKAQTGIGTTTPNASAKLEVASTSQGFLPPRVTLTGTGDNTTIKNSAGTGGTAVNVNPGIIWYWVR